MHSGLLNIWRENGAYLRYGDAKCLFLATSCIALFFSFLTYQSISELAPWSVIGALKALSLSMSAYVALFSFSLGALVSLIAVMPSLSANLGRVRLLNVVGRFLHFGGKVTSPTDVVYFDQVARYPSAEHYEVALNSRLEPADWSPADKDLINQIWIVSQIASSKFTAAKISILCLSIGVVAAAL
jgi:hypothetical protein